MEIRVVSLQKLEEFSQLRSVNKSCKIEFLEDGNPESTHDFKIKV